MDFIKDLLDSDKDSESSPRRQRNSMNKNYKKSEEYNNKKKRKPGVDPEVGGVPRRPARNAVEPEPEPEPERATLTRPKSRAVVLPSGLIIGSDDSSVNTSSLSSHSSDSFNSRNMANQMVNLEDVDNGLNSDDRKNSTVKRRIRTIGGGASLRRRSSAGGLGRSVSAPAGGTKLSLAERRTLRRAERVGLVEKKQLPCCTRIGYEFTIAVQKTTRRLQEWLRNFQVWGKPIKEIEGNLGSGVSTYFRVLRWLLKINTISMILALGLVVAPGIWMSENHTLPGTSYNKDDLKCLNPDFVEGTETWHQVTNSILQFLTGQGWMEATAMYIGWYPASNITRNDNGVEKTTYNFPLAYLSVGLIYFLVALVFICSNIARLFKKAAVEQVETKVTPVTR